ncbi:MAG: type II secretion system major pseudopilin GspG [Pseudomonadota bacterium]
MKKASGFTLIELLVVLAILGMLAALVGPAIFSNLGKGQKATAASQISNIESALDSYRLDVGRYPETLEGLSENDTGRDAWAGPYLRGDLPKDPWGNDYFYQPGDKDFVLQSYGKDGTPDGEGDDADIGR